MFLHKELWYLLGLVPVRTIGESPNYFQCGRCGEAFEEAGDWPFDFGDHAEPRLWDCRSCGAENTNETFRCKHCGKHI